jgi:molybdate transport system substrate-binding protein
MHHAHVYFLLLLALGGSSSCVEARQKPAPIRIAAASDLTRAFSQLAADFERETGQPVALTFGSTGLLSKQLLQGAPFDVFAAASATYVDEVVRAGVCEGKTRARYGRGRLALWSRSDLLPASPSRALGELASARFKRIAIAQPEHAPYGKAAREALVAAGIWQLIEARLVFAENVRQAYQLGQTHNVEAALVALSLVVDAPSDEWLLVDASLHAPVEQELVACLRGRQPEGGRNFAAYVGSAHGRAVMVHFGFLLPNEAWGRAP